MELLASLQDARIAPDGPSRLEREMSSNATLDLGGFRFSYDRNSD